MLGAALLPEIQELIAARQFATLRDVLCDLPPADVAEILSDLEAEDACVLFRIMPRHFAADVFEHLELKDQTRMLRGLAAETVASILNEMTPDDRTALLEELPPQATEVLLGMLEPEERAIARTLLGYPEYSVGRLMTTEYVRLKAEWTASHSIEQIRQHGRDRETINVLYVTDVKGRLLGDVTLRSLILNKPEALVSEMMDENVAKLSAFDEQEKAVATFERYDRSALPVVDSEGILVGIVTVDDILDVAAEEATEDIHKMGGTAALEEPYLETSVPDLVRKRAGWLVVLFLGQMLTETAMGAFEDEIAAAVVLALFVPLVISSGGNTGSQSATLVIRALSVGDVTIADWWRIMRREIMCGMALGGILGVLGFIRIAGWSTYISPGHYGEHYFMVALAVALSLVGIVLWGSLVGSMMPLLMKRIGADPAVSSTPFVATLVDVTGLIIYFSVAVAVLKGTVL